jgi:PAS domain S-box-containing protein
MKIEVDNMAFLKNIKGYKIFLLAGLLVLSLSVRSFAVPKWDFNSRKILVLHSYNKTMLWADGLTEGVLSVLGDDTLMQYELSFEYMDTKRIFNPQYLDLLYDLFKLRYVDSKFDLIITFDDDAFNFIIDRPDLFPNTPVVFGGLNYFEDSFLEIYTNITGVAEFYDLERTLEVALWLHPETKEVVVVNDLTATGVGNKKRVMEVMPIFEDRVSFRFLEDYTIEELCGKVAELDKGSIILLLSFNRDKDGRNLRYRPLARLISESSKVPIYGVWEFYLGKGIVGGKLTSGFYHGKTTAEIAKRVLDGEHPQNIPVVKHGAENKYMFDYRQLKRFKIHRNKLPQGSVVINFPNIFENITPRIILILGILILLFLIGWFVNYILHQRARRRYLSSEDRYKKLTESSFEGIVIHTDGVILDANRSFSEMMGYSLDRLIGMKIADLIAPEIREEIMKKIREGYDKPLESIMVKSDGTKISVEACGKNIEYMGKSARVAAIRDITHQKTAAEAMKRRYNFEQTVANFLSRFVEVTDINYVINTSLVDLGKFAKAARSYVFLLNSDGETITNTHEWCADGIEPQIENLRKLPRQNVPWWDALIMKGETIHIPDVEALPPEATSEKEILEAQDIKSLIVVPLKANQEVVGFVGLDNTGATGLWEEDIIAMLRLFAEVLGKVIGRNYKSD